jgi:hypothetical protein
LFSYFLEELLAEQARSAPPSYMTAEQQHRFCDSRAAGLQPDGSSVEPQDSRISRFCDEVAIRDQDRTAPIGEASICPKKDQILLNL